MNKFIPVEFQCDLDFLGRKSGFSVCLPLFYVAHSNRYIFVIKPLHHIFDVTRKKSIGIIVLKNKDYLKANNGNAERQKRKKVILLFCAIENTNCLLFEIQY